jgi:hypothetical protein
VDLGRDEARQPGAVPVTVEHQAVHGTEHEERHEDVEEREPGQHELETVEAQDQPGDAAQEGRAGEPAYEPDHHQDQERADHSRHDPPAEGREAEQLLADPDQPLADLGVDDHGRVGLPQAGGLSGQDVLVGDPAVVGDVVAGVAEVPQRPGVLGVVGLVELEGVRSAQLPEPEEQRQERDRQRRRPADERVLEAPAGPRALRRQRDGVALGVVRQTGHPPPRRGCGWSGRHGPPL